MDACITTPPDEKTTHFYPLEDKPVWERRASANSLWSSVRTQGGSGRHLQQFGGLNAHSQGEENNLVNPRHHESRRERISARPTRDNPRFSQKSDWKQTNKKELTWGQIFAKVVKRKGEDSPASSSSMLQHHRLFMFPFRPELRPHLCWRSGSQRVEANRADKLDYYSSSHLCGNNIYTLMWLW